MSMHVVTKEIFKICHEADEEAFLPGSASHEIL